MEPEPQISFSLKEYLVRLEGKIDGLAAAVGGKLESLTERVARIEHRLDSDERREKALEQASERRASFRRWAWPTLFRGASAIIALAALAIALLR